MLKAAGGANIQLWQNIHSFNVDMTQLINQSEVFFFEKLGMSILLF